MKQEGSSTGRMEVNFDGIVGPTHHYGGLSTGNVASTGSRWEISRPREAALQGLAKMKRLADLGLPQAVLPPQERPVFAILKGVGFTGSEEEIVRQAWNEAPALLSACFSASAMWTANAATFTPSSDTLDGRAHFTPANLVSMFHRSLEPPRTAQALRTIFGEEQFFVHHEPLPPGRPLGDEGAANHTRLAARSDEAGLHLFVYGFSPFEEEPRLRFPARQSLEASRAVARLHGIPPERTFYLRQAPEAIEVGVFHNDVASVGNENLFLYHEKAFAEGAAGIERLREKFAAVCGGELGCREVPEAHVSLREAVRTYVFNSQLVTLPGTREMMLLAPLECRESKPVTAVIENWIRDPGNPIVKVDYVDLRESMRNGGGPACLRLRVVLSKREMSALRGRVLLTPDLAADLEAWVRRHYRESLSPPDLADPRLIEEGRRALAELTGLLELGG